MITQGVDEHDLALKVAIGGINGMLNAAEDQALSRELMIDATSLILAAWASTSLIVERRNHRTKTPKSGK